MVHKKVSYPLATHITENPHPLWQGCLCVAINMSAAVSKMFMQTHTQKQNTPFLCTAVLGSGSTGERRYLSPCGCGRSAKAVFEYSCDIRVSFGCVLQCWERFFSHESTALQNYKTAWYSNSGLSFCCLKFSVFVWVLFLKSSLVWRGFIFLSSPPESLFFSVC